MANSGETTRIGAGESVPPFTQDPDYWYPDGTVILLAHAEVAFRVHKGILADHSTVFGDLFAVSQPQDGEWYADCPIVNLSDAPGEVRWLLKAIYHSRRHYMPDQQVPFSMVAALIRLGHKYAVDDLVSSALVRLASCFSPDFDTYCASITAGGSKYMACTPKVAIAAVNLARLLGDEACAILPSALYTCCQLAPDTLTRGVANEDGETETLSVADVELCIDARARLAGLTLSSAIRRCQPNTKSRNGLGERNEDEEQCVQVFCSPYLVSATNRILNRTLGLPTLCGALDSMEGFITDSVRGGLLCRHCAERARAKDRRERLQVWQTLPAILGLQMKSWGGSNEGKL